jgi:23S rRNA (cytidine1920-2'-O)/16S rRNA (cytidine1409-2'-O)-methyltransferase
VTLEQLEILKENLYVSRGAHKIEGALKDFKIDPKDLIVADVGASTGGFTEYVLSLGAQKVYAIDVGHDQLAESLKKNSKVINLEGVNIKFPYSLSELVDLVVVDLSFISVRLVLKNIFELVRPGGKIVVLVKPQFEVGRAGLSKNGIVKSEELRLNAINDLKLWCNENKFLVENETSCAIAGKTGNQEHFFYFIKK